MQDHISTSGEVWKAIPSFPGYEASSAGRIRSVDRVIIRSDGTARRVQGLVLQPGINRNGYPKVSMSIDGKRYTREIHPLICEAFWGPRPPGHEAAHDDGDRLNPAPANVLWKTKADNIADRTRHGRENIGGRNGQARLTPDQAIAICRRARRGESLRALGKEYGIVTPHVLRIRDGVKWAKATSFIRETTPCRNSRGRLLSR
jgi:hypothetical protein